MISRRDFLAGLAATAVLPPLLAARASEPDWTPREVSEKYWDEDLGVTMFVEQRRVTATEVNRAQQEMRRKFLRDLDDAFRTIRDAPSIPTHFRGFSSRYGYDS